VRPGRARAGTANRTGGAMVSVMRPPLRPRRAGRAVPAARDGRERPRGTARRPRGGGGDRGIAIGDVL